MNIQEVARREKLHMDHVGDVILTKSIIPESAPLVSFKAGYTKNVYQAIRGLNRLTKEDQIAYDGSGVQKLRVWFSGPTTRAVRRTFADAGFLQSAKETLAWNVCWGSPKGLEFYQTLRPGQLCNQIPGSNSMGRKDTLASFMKAGAARQPHLYNFAPVQFMIPNELSALRADMEKYANTEMMYIYKPAMGARGNGIKILSPNDMLPCTKTAAVVQHYIMNPLLLQGFKFDLRIYVVVTSVYPLIFYIYEEGLGRFATEKFIKPNAENKDHAQMHLTNFSVNCKADAFVEKDDDQIVELGHNLPSKWKATELLDFLDQNREVFSQETDSIVKQISAAPGALKQELWKRIQDVVKLTMTAVESRMYSFSDKAGSLQSYPRRNFGLYGFDIMLSDKGKPLLIEVNSSPATGTSTALDVAVKFELLSDVMHLAGVNCNFNDGKIVYPERSTDSEIELDKNVKQFVLGENEEMYSMTTEQLRKGDKLVPINYKNLSRFEKRALLQIIEDSNRCGRFQRLSPSGEEDFCDVFEEKRYLNELANAAVKFGLKEGDL
ncbi:Tubulin_tyrosine ligase [Hexamita inflata]|uniref:Tubulin--tyrosine ligase-like protein 5 n=1 Tax=Hexamita inflata TaxID=28002 RepID=A0AA86UM42_9EUKA|nr:Tubulin tyrosine ligase [Hexamita inflata]